jgi:hypothetical protein
MIRLILASDNFPMEGSFFGSSARVVLLSSLLAVKIHSLLKVFLFVFF